MTLEQVHDIISQPIPTMDETALAFSEYKRGELTRELYEQAAALTQEVARALDTPSKPEEMIKRSMVFPCSGDFRLYMSFYNNLDLTCCGYSVGWIPDPDEIYPWSDELQRVVDSLDPIFTMGGLSFDEDYNRLNFYDLFILHTLTPAMFTASLALGLMEIGMIKSSFAPFRLM